MPNNGSFVTNIDVTDIKTFHQFKYDREVAPLKIFNANFSVGQIIALPSIMGKADLWGWYFALTAVPAILWLISYPFTGKKKRFSQK